MMIVRCLVIAGVLFLAACASNDGDMPAPTVTPEPPAALSPVEQLNALATASQVETLMAAVRAANSLPQFGDNITQSANSDENGISSDDGSTAFDGQRLTASITRKNASALAFDTATDTVFSTDIPYIPGYTLRNWTLLNVTPEGASVSYHVISWNNTNPMDYLAAGYWLHLAGDAQSLQFTDAEVGVFVDGPELSTATAPELPVSGQLNYAGPAQGFYVGRYGTHPVVAEGSTEFGEFSSTIQLTAYFDSQTAGRIEGCMGCESGIQISDLFFVDGASGAQQELGSRRLPHQVHLQAPLSTDGTFRDRGVNVVVEATTGVELTESSGTWGGKFSNAADVVAGDPRLVAGTLSAAFKSAIGGEGAFLGTFVGLKQPPAGDPGM